MNKIVPMSVGYGILSQFKSREAFSDTAEITIYFNSKSHRSGYGSQMLFFLEEFAKQQCFHVLVSLVSGENHGSCELFKKCNYTQCAVFHEVGRKFNRWVDLICFEKKLDCLPAS